MFDSMKRLGVVAVAVLLLAPVALARDDASDFSDRIQAMVESLNRDVQVDQGMSRVYASIVRDEFRTPQSELEWALGESISWGEIAVLSYIHATTGLGFDELVAENAHIDVQGFSSRMEMSTDKMIGSLEMFAARTLRERNSRIFDRMRSAGRLDQLPDLGNGFGLFQEALDFRQIGRPSPTKVHAGVEVLKKGGKEN